MMAEARMQPVQPVLGWAGFAAGAAALFLALAIFWAGPFGAEPEPVSAPSVFERVSEAARSVLGGEGAEAEVPPPQPARDVDALARTAVAGLGGLAVVLGLAGFARREPRRPAFTAVTLGGGAIIFQIVTGFILILICLMLVGTVSRGGDSIGEILSGILEAIAGFFSAIGDFFSNLFGGLFGG